MTVSGGGVVRMYVETPSEASECRGVLGVTGGATPRRESVHLAWSMPAATLNSEVGLGQGRCAFHRQPRA